MQTFVAWLIAWPLSNGYHLHLVSVNLKLVCVLSLAMTQKWQAQLMGLGLGITRLSASGDSKQRALLYFLSLQLCND